MVWTVSPGTVISRTPMSVPKPPGDSTVTRTLRVGPAATLSGCGACCSDTAVRRVPWSVRTVTLLSLPRTGPAYNGVTVKLVTSSNGTLWSAPNKITSGADKVYPSVGANAGRIVVGYYTREFSPVPSDANRSCGIMELDTATNMVVAPVDPTRKAAAVCLDWALKSSSDNFAGTTRVSAQSSNPYILFSGSFIGDYTGTSVNRFGKAVTVWTDFRGNPGVTSPNQDTVVSGSR